MFIDFLFLFSFRFEIRDFSNLLTFHLGTKYCTLYYCLDDNMLFCNLNGVLRIKCHGNVPFIDFLSSCTFI